MLAKYSNQQKNINEKEIQEAAEEIKKGNLVLFPTETVYGIGANALNSEATKKIFEAKGRATDNPLIAHVSDFIMLQAIVKEVGAIEEKLIKEFWPGPLTIIFERKNEKIVPNTTTANLDTVAVRMPSNTIAQKLIAYAGVPIAAPSANVSGRPSGTKVEDIVAELGDKVSYVIDGGATDIGVESTVIIVKNDKITILRPGKITKEQLEKIAPVAIDEHVLGSIDTNQPVASPGMKYRHYAPNTTCIMFYSQDNTKLVNKINEVIIEKEQQNQQVLVLAKTQNIKNYATKNTLDMGQSLEEIAKNIFTLLRQVDKYKADLVIIEGVGEEGLGLAITNRLIRACSHQYFLI